MIYFILTGIIVLIDQISKYFAQTYLSKVNTFPLIQDVFHLTYKENTGAAFSILMGKQTFLILVTTFVIVILLGLLYKTLGTSQALLSLSLAFIIGGAIGNLIDRVRLGYVVDYFDFTLTNFAVFNVADSFVVVGTIILSYLILFKDIKIV